MVFSVCGFFPRAGWIRGNVMMETARDGQGDVGDRPTRSPIADQKVGDG